MLVLTNVQDNRAPTTSYNTNAAVMNATSFGGATWNFLWCATARNNQTGAGSIAPPDAQSSRTAQACYMRGLSEKIEIITNTSLPWQWRRIVIAAKGIQAVLTETSTTYFRNITSAGYARTVNEIGTANQVNLHNILFKGEVNKDWKDQFIAPLDTTKFRVLCDKTINIRSSAEGGMMRKYNMWHPMNKTLIYADDESGGQEATAEFSSPYVGLGDVWVYDIFRPAYQGTGSLLFNPNTTLYWHEK